MRLAARAQARSSVWSQGGSPVTHLRKVMLEELHRRNYSAETIRTYIGAVERFARYFGKPPDQLGPEHIRQYQAYLLHERKLAVGTVVTQVAGLRFFFVRTLKRRFPPDTIPYPKYTKRSMPKVLSPEEVARLIEAAGNLQARVLLMLLYSTGIRRRELIRLRVEDINSERMMILLPCGVHRAAPTQRTGARKPARILRPLIHRQRSNTIKGSGQSQTPGRPNRRDQYSAHLGTEPAAEPSLIMPVIII